MLLSSCSLVFFFSIVAEPRETQASVPWATSYSHRLAPKHTQSLPFFLSNRYMMNPSTRNSKSPDLDLYVKGVAFHLHKETLAKRSARVTTLLECNKLHELGWILRDMDINPSTFHLVTRFCYGYKIELSAENIVSVLCIAYYLDMSDDHSSNNLLNKAVTFLEQRVLMSWNETVKALCICSDKILDKLVDVGLIEVFLDSLVEKAHNDPRLLHDLITLPLRLYEPLILELSKHNVSIENLVASVCNYAKIWVFEKDSGDESVSRHMKEVIEAVERLLPYERGTISCGFLFKSLKESTILDASSDCRKGFEVRISKQLDMAKAKDLLILLPKEDGSYDIELLKTILKSFYSNYSVSDVSRFVSVARMLEEFLLEAAASDADLRVGTFKELAEIAVAASCDVLRYSDGIYRAIDVFLERHGDLIESEKMEACRVLEWKKLSPEACEHASTNENLPLRIVVKVLGVSQVHIRDAVAREMKGAEEKTEDREDEDDEVDNMTKNLLRLEIQPDYSNYSKKRKTENLGCVVHCENKKMNEKKISVWREVKRKFGCMTSSTVDACNCHIKKRKKTNHRYK